MEQSSWFLWVDESVCRMDNGVTFMLKHFNPNMKHLYACSFAALRPQHSLSCILWWLPLLLCAAWNITKWVFFNRLHILAPIFIKAFLALYFNKGVAVLLILIKLTFRLALDNDHEQSFQMWTQLLFVLRSVNHGRRFKPLNYFVISLMLVL